jgi:hypothetical protein
MMRIRDLLTRDPGWKNFLSGIRYKHSGSATLLMIVQVPQVPISQRPYPLTVSNGIISFIVNTGTNIPGRRVLIFSQLLVQFHFNWSSSTRYGNSTN